jgi:hypothetical protein
MSTANIVSKVPLPDMSGIIVTFDSHGRQKSYFYEGEEACMRILGGADPSGYDGKRIS